MKHLAILLMLVMLAGCSTPGIRCKVVDTDTVEFSPIPAKDPVQGFFAWLFPPSLPQGDYTFKKTGDTIEATASTKKELKLLDFNMLKNDT